MQLRPQVLRFAAIAVITAVAGVTGTSSSNAVPVVEQQPRIVIETPARYLPARPLPLPRAAVSPKSPRPIIQAMQQRLRWVGFDWLWLSGNIDSGTLLALRMFQHKFFLPTGGPNAATVAKLIDTAGTGKLDERCLGTGITLCVDKTQKLTRFVRDGSVVRTLNTNFGPEKTDPKYGFYSATREGEFAVFVKSEVAVSSLYNTSMPYWMAFDGGIGFHYSEYFHKTGYFDTSMGCTTLEDLGGAKWLFENTPMGTKVVVYRSSANDSLERVSSATNRR